MIAGLCMLKLYQTRHPDINASAYAAYASFALVITLTVLGVVCPSPRPAALLGGFFSGGDLVERSAHHITSTTDPPSGPACSAVRFRIV